MLLQVQGLGRRLGARWLFRDASLVANAGDRIGLVGPNGAGKSTLLRLIAGDEVADAGQVQRPRQVRLGMLRQEIDPGLQHSVREEASRALARLDELDAEIHRLHDAMAEAGERGEVISDELAERYDRARSEFEHGGGFEREARVASVLAGLGFDDAARERPLASFSGGWLMRVELAKLFLAEPDVLLLDEPTNHLDLPAIQWFEETIAAFPGAVIVVSHDRTFLRKHVRRVVDLDGHGGCTVYEGGYDRFLELRAERRTQLLAAKANQDREIAQMERFVERFRAKATKAKQAQSRIKALEKIERIEVAPGARREMRMHIPEPPRSGQEVLALHAIHKHYGQNVVYRGIEFNVQRGDRVALAGPNGAGKSTLLRIAAGALDFDAGERKLGHNVHIAFFAQHQLEALDPTLSVLEELGRDARTEDIPRLRSHLGAFLFSGDDVDKKISVLSGGEKARVALAKMLLAPANLLVLDEPTNHLDIESCEVLERALQSYKGTLIFVSHDRMFINALATRVVEVRYGVLREFIGNYDDYLYRLGSEQEAAHGRPAEIVPERTAPSAPSSTPPTPAAGQRPSKGMRALDRERRKTRDKLARRIARLEEEIHTHEKSIEALDWRLGDPEIYSNAERVAEIDAEKSGLRELIDGLYSDWERHADELAALDDAIEPGGAD